MAACSAAVPVVVDQVGEAPAVADLAPKVVPVKGDLKAKDDLRVRVLPEPVVPVREIVLLVREADLVRDDPEKAGRVTVDRAVPVDVAPAVVRVRAAMLNSIRWSV